MISGIDEAWQRAPISVLNTDGYKFVCRYLSYDTTGKNLTPEEAAALTAGGEAIVSNWEYSATAARNGYTQGVKDATEAARQHAADGGPADRPIYFSVDFDIPDYAPASSDPAAKLGPVADYFRGVISVIGLVRTGAYGGFYAVSRLFDAGLIKWGWQAYAWSGGQWDSRAQIRQVRNGVMVGGADVDLDEAQVPDFGQWTVSTTPAPAPAPAPAPTPTNPTEVIVGKLPLLQRGATGGHVFILQGLLRGHGYSTVIDGNFGPATDTDVRRFQGSRGLTVDGVVGTAQTWPGLLDV